MRRWFGHLVNDERHKRGELTVDGGRLLHDPTWGMGLVVNDGDSWGKITTLSSRLSRREESINGVGVSG
jgi:hypothetical protein